MRINLKIAFAALGWTILYPPLSIAAEVAQPPVLQWQPYEQLEYMRSLHDKYATSELVLTNRLQSLMSQEHPSEALIQSYLRRLISTCALQEKWDAAAEYCQIAIRFAEKQPAAQADIAMLHATLAKILSRAGKLTQAELEYAKSLSILDNSADATALARTRLGLADLMLRQNRLAEAEKIFREVLASPDNAAPAELVTFADCLSRQGKYTEAKELLLQALKIDRDQLGESQPALAADHNNLAAVLCQLGDLSAAQQEMREAIKICRSHSYANIADWLNNLLLVERALGNKENADRLQDEINKLKTAAKARPTL
jgi:tetratricopeptide (TPR) repeat protein